METFEVFVRTPFGKYNGTMSFSRLNGIVNGSLSFLVFSSDFSGASDGDDISFKGYMETPIGKLDYDARATIKNSVIEGSAETRLGTMAFSSREGR